MSRFCSSARCTPSSVRAAAGWSQKSSSEISLSCTASMSSACGPSLRVRGIRPSARLTVRLTYRLTRSTELRSSRALSNAFPYRLCLSVWPCTPSGCACMHVPCAGPARCLEQRDVLPVGEQARRRAPGSLAMIHLERLAKRPDGLDGRVLEPPVAAGAPHAAFLPVSIRLDRYMAYTVRLYLSTGGTSVRALSWIVRDVVRVAFAVELLSEPRCAWPCPSPRWLG